MAGDHDRRRRLGDLAEVRHVRRRVDEWVTSSFGLVLTIGGLLATAAAYFGITGIGNNVEKLVELGDQVAASGGPPTPEQGAQMAHLGAEIKKHGQIDIVLLFLAVAAMATARYW